METLSSADTKMPAVYEIGRYPDETYLSLGPLSISALTDWLVSSDDVAYANMILMQD